MLKNINIHKFAQRTFQGSYGSLELNTTFFIIFNEAILCLNRTIITLLKRLYSCTLNSMRHTNRALLSLLSFASYTILYIEKSLHRDIFNIYFIKEHLSIEKSKIVPSIYKKKFKYFRLFLIYPVEKVSNRCL